MTWLYRFFNIILKPVAHILFKLNIIGLENIPKDRPFVLCCNHTSISDMVLLIAFCPRQVCFMSKKEVFKYKIVAWFMRQMRAFPVDRGARDISAIRSACEVIKRGDVLGIFPEGTRYKDYTPPHKFLPGSAFVAMKTGADILPVAIYKDSKISFLRRKVTLRFGDIIESSALCDGKPTKEKITEVSNKLHKAITDLWELKH